MRRRITAITLTMSAVTLASGLGGATTTATAATGASASVTAAAKTWTVTPGGAATATSGRIRLTDTTTNRAGTCTSSDVAGKLKTGTGLAGHDIGSVTAATFSTCTGPAHTQFTVTATDLPWRISFATYDPATGVVSGTVSHLRVTVSGACKAVVNGTSAAAADGTVAASYTDSTGVLKFRTVGGNLHFWHVKDCSPLINDGDPATFSASYTITPPQVITSP